MNKPDVLRPTDEEAIRLAKTIVRTARSGTLATLAPGSGDPQATRVGMSTDFDGTPVLLISRLAAHWAALEADKRCSLLVGETGKGDPLAHARITISAHAETVSREDERYQGLRQRYLSHQPKAKLYVDLGDFSFVRLTPKAASLNGGFGKAYALAAEQILSFADDELAAAEFRALEHMNDDHLDAVANYAKFYCNAPIGPWNLVGIDADGITISWGDDVRRIFFDTPISTPKDIHMTLVAMARKASSVE